MKRMGDSMENTFGSYHDFCLAAAGKKCVLFGAGSYTGRIIEYIQKDVKVSYIVDNNFWRWEERVGGLEILPPSTLTGENRDEVVVLIAIAQVYEVDEQLRGYGLKYIYAFNMFIDKLYDDFDRIGLRIGLNQRDYIW